MKNTFTPLKGRLGLYCVWIETGNPRCPLACVWIDPEFRNIRIAEETSLTPARAIAKDAELETPSRRLQGKLTF